jgi:murein DD-endopeptidase MepM/ murein hydrolase activator NlpD
MRRQLGRAALACAVVLVTLGPATASRADEPTPTPSAPAGATASDLADLADLAGLAGQPADLAAALDQVRSQLAESSQAMVEAATNLTLADHALPEARATAGRTRTLLAEARRREAATARRRGQAQVRFMLSTQAAEQTAADVATQQARIGRLARAVYQGGGALGNVSVLMGASSPADLAERLVSLQTVVSSQRSALDQLETVKASYGAQTTDLQKVRDDVAAADEQAQKDLRAVTALADQARAAEEKVSGLVAARKAALAAAAAAQAAEDAAHANLVGESTQLQAQLAAQAGDLLGPAGQRNGATVPPVAGTFDWPARGPITSPFGMRVHPVTGVYKLHTGTDLGIPCGTPVHVARAGTIIQAGWNSAYGWRTVVSHGNVDGVLLTTTYNHQSHIGVAVGDQVAAGQVIGLSGTTGFSTGCHLHFEVYVNGALVDPEPWLPPH